MLVSFELQFRYQKDTHARLLETIDGAIGAFYKDIALRGETNETLILVFSEFGRRVRENGSLRTDHGTAEPGLRSCCY